jgi:uncharacterized protein YegP (UPF0339 family)
VSNLKLGLYFTIKKRLFLSHAKQSGKFRFNLKAENGQTTLPSGAYEAKLGAENGVESTRKNAPDDNEDMRLFMKFLLESYGYQVIEAVDGPDALNFHFLPDLPE